MSDRTAFYGLHYLEPPRRAPDRSRSDETSVLHSFKCKFNAVKFHRGRPDGSPQSLKTQDGGPKYKKQRTTVQNRKTRESRTGRRPRAPSQYKSLTKVCAKMFEKTLEIERKQTIRTLPSTSSGG